MGHKSYSILIGLGLVALIGALIGFCSQPSIYQSSGLILINPVVPSLDASAGSLIPNASVFMNSQVETIQTPEMVRRAMDEAVWRDLHRPQTAAGVNDFLKNLDVQQIPGTSLIRITVRDPDPKAAQAGATAICLAYRDYYYDELDPLSINRRLDILETQKSVISNDLQAERSELSNLSKNYGTADLDAYEQEQLTQLNDLRRDEATAVREYEEAQAALGAASGNGDGGNPKPKPDATAATTMVALQSDLDAKRVRKDLLNDQIAKQDDYVHEVGVQAQLIDEVKQKIGTAQQDLDVVTREVETLNSQKSLMTSSMQIASMPALPTEPIPNKREQFAILGLVGAVQLLAFVASIVAVARRSSRSRLAWISFSGSLVLWALIIWVLATGNISNIF